MKTVIIGLGNPILTDDGVGVKAAYALKNQLAARSWLPATPVDVMEASVGGLRLMEMMIGYDRAILVDAIRYGRNHPGHMHRMTLDELRTISPTQHSASAHDTTLVTALDAGHAMGLHLPKEVVIFAIEVENVSEFGEEPTTAVSAAIPEVVTAVINECRSQKVF